jgi:hypothetical protein
VRMRDVVAELRTFAAEIACLCHDSKLQNRQSKCGTEAGQGAQTHTILQRIAETPVYAESGRGPMTVSLRLLTEHCLSHEQPGDFAPSRRPAAKKRPWYHVFTLSCLVVSLSRLHPPDRPPRKFPRPSA